MPGDALPAVALNFGHKMYVKFRFFNIKNTNMHPSTNHFSERLKKDLNQINLLMAVCLEKNLPAKGLIFRQ